MSHDMLTPQVLLITEFSGTGGFWKNFRTAIALSLDLEK